MQEGPVLVTEPTHNSAIKLLEDFLIKTKTRKKGKTAIFTGGGGELKEKKRLKMPQGPCSAGEMRICIFIPFQYILTRYVQLLFLLSYFLIIFDKFKRSLAT